MIRSSKDLLPRIGNLFGRTEAAVWPRELNASKSCWKLWHFPAHQLYARCTECVCLFGWCYRTSYPGGSSYYNRVLRDLSVRAVYVCFLSRVTGLIMPVRFSGVCYGTSYTIGSSYWVLRDLSIRAVYVCVFLRHVTGLIMFRSLFLGEVLRDLYIRRCAFYRPLGVRLTSSLPPSHPVSIHSSCCMHDLLVFFFLFFFLSGMVRKGEYLRGGIVRPHVYSPKFQDGLWAGSFAATPRSLVVGSYIGRGWERYIMRSWATCVFFFFPVAFFAFFVLFLIVLAKYCCCCCCCCYCGRFKRHAFLVSIQYIHYFWTYRMSLEYFWIFGYILFNIFGFTTYTGVDREEGEVFYSWRGWARECLPLMLSIAFGEK